MSDDPCLHALLVHLGQISGLSALWRVTVHGRNQSALQSIIRCTFMPAVHSDRQCLAINSNCRDA